MIKNFTSEQFNNAKGSDELELICEYCGLIFTKPKRKIQRVSNPSSCSNYDFCSRECRSLSNNPDKLFICKQCGKKFYRKEKNHSSNLFCSQSCAAKFNNSINPKRKKQAHYHCSICGSEIPLNRKYCKSCRDKIYENKVQRTIADFHSERSYQINSKIRTFARTKIKQSGVPMVCQICGYDKHVEIHHIKPISSFSTDTTIDEVNNINNLAVLCPNCHWEADNGLIKF